jgi:hypothetical protein
MAKVYAGDLNSVDQEVLEAVRGLPSDYWAFASFNVGREIDWFIVRAQPEPDGHSTLILMELKRSGVPLRGPVTDAQWERQDPYAGWQVIDAGNDRNYYWQAVNAGNALQKWLWNNQAIYRETTDLRPTDDFGVWPDLLVLSPPEVRHYFPIAPQSGFGNFFHGPNALSAWLAHIEAWDPTRGRRNLVSLSEQQLQNLASALHLSPVWDDSPSSTVEGNISIEGEISMEDVMRRLGQIEETLKRVEHHLFERPSRQVIPTGSQPAKDQIRMLSSEERDAIVGGVRDVRAQAKSRALPTVLEYVNRRFGYDLKDRSYNGFPGAKAMFDQARREGIVVFGPNSGPSPTIYLPEESTPALTPAVPNW